MEDVTGGPAVVIPLVAAGPVGFVRYGRRRSVARHAEVLASFSVRPTSTAPRSWP